MSVAGPENRLIERILALAAERQVPVAGLSTDAIAKGLGMSRSSLYRRIGSREALNAALKRAGHDTGEQPSATERMLQAAGELIRQGGHQALTLDAVATRADVALPTVFARFGNRAGLLTAVFERYSPIPRIQRHLHPLQPGDTAGFRRCIAAIYREIWDVLSSEYTLVSAMIIEVLRDPQGDVREFLEKRYLPQVFERILPWLGENIALGLVRPVSPLLLGQTLVAPLVMHIATRPLVLSARVAPLPSREEACEHFADLYCAAILAQM